jgi:hypothetical protein
MEEFEKKETLNPFLKWLGGFLICPIAILAAVCGEMIWAVEFAGIGIICLLIRASRNYGTSDLLASFMRCAAAVLAVLSIIIVCVDIFMWRWTFFLLVTIVGLLLLSFFDRYDLQL